MDQLMGRAAWKAYSDGSWPPAMLVQAGHTAPMLYYPASRSTPPYLVQPAVLEAPPLEWDDWRVVTPRMQRIMTAALKQGTNLRCEIMKNCGSAYAARRISQPAGQWAAVSERSF